MLLLSVVFTVLTKDVIKYITSLVFTDSETNIKHILKQTTKFKLLKPA